MFLNSILTLVFVYSLFSASADEFQWLPKCCPRGKQISSDGKSCVEDPSVGFLYNVTANDSDSNFTDVDTLTVTTDDGNVSYQLEHRGKFSCVRQELYVVQDDITVTAEGDQRQVVVTDDFGHPWALAPQEVCVDSVQLQGLVPDRVFVALLCPDCRRVHCLQKCCPEDKDLQVSDDGSMVDCVPSVTSWTKEILENNASKLVKLVK